MCSATTCGDRAVLIPTTILTEGSGKLSYTPALTASVSDPTLGSGSSTSGFYIVDGKLVTVWSGIIFGSSGAAAGSGTYRVSLPVAADPSQGRFLGSGFLFKDGVASLLVCDLDAANQRVTMWVNAGTAQVTHAFFPTPNDDQIHINLSYVST